MAIVFIPRGMCNAYNEGAEKARKIMIKYSEEYVKKLYRLKLNRMLKDYIIYIIELLTLAICGGLLAVMAIRESQFVIMGVLIISMITMITVMFCIVGKCNKIIDKLTETK